MKNSICRKNDFVLTNSLIAFFLFSAIIFIACSDAPRRGLENASGGLGAQEQPEIEKPASRAQSSSSVAASEITKIILGDWRHEGPLSAPGGSVVSNSVGFSRDGTAFKSENAVNFDDGQKQPPNEYTGVVTAQQFERLAQTAVENDFLNESDSLNARSEAQTRLTIFYAGREKTILTGNTGEDTPQTAAILRVFEELKSRVEWKKK